MSKKGLGRRDFFKQTVAAGAALGAASELAHAAEGDEAAPTIEMPRKKLGSTGETVPILCQGEA